MNLYTKTFLYSFVLMLVITFVGHSLLYYLIPKVYTNQKRDFAKEITEQMVKNFENLDSKDVEESLKNFSEKNNVFAMLTYGENTYFFGKMLLEDLISNKDKSLSFESSLSKPSDKEYSDKDYKITSSENSLENSLENLFVLTNSQYIRESLKFQNINGEECELETIITLQSVNETKNVILQILPYTLFVCFLISIIFALLFSKKLTKPIVIISNTTKKMKLLEPLLQCEVKSKDEIGQLSNDINVLYEDLLFVIGKLKDELEHNNEVEETKIEFLRSASHELKTPVSAVRTLLDNMIMRVGKYEDYDTYLPICRDMLVRLSGMIQEVLDVSKLESSTENEKMVETDLKIFIDGVVEPYEIIAKSKGIHLEIIYHEELKVLLPKMEMKKVISNILSNAVNYTETKNTITIIIGNRKVIVQNECLPISNSDLLHIFEAFYRVEQSRNRNYGGNGLGLYFVSKVLKKYHYQFEFTPIQNGMQFVIYF